MNSNSKRVTIGIPVYKRLEYLPRVFDIVRSQDYRNIELLVSDNGVNGDTVRNAVRMHYPSARFRQNPQTVGMSAHFNQIISEANGDYFVLLADDDEITSNYISDLVDLLDRHPKASVAMGIQETLDETGLVLRRSSARVPEVLSGPEFIRAAWKTHEYGFQSFSTFMARTARMKKSGGYPDFWKGTGNDDALLIKLCFDNFVALSPRCAFKKRFYGTSYGFGMEVSELARGIRDLLKFLGADPVILDFAKQNPAAWSESKRVVVDMAWKTYYYRWTTMYRARLTPFQWIRAGFNLPLIPEYYRLVVRDCCFASKSILWGGVRQLFGRTDEALGSGQAGAKD